MDLKEEAYLKTICPFIKNPPSEDCYNTKMDSRSIMSILEYCAKNYWDCGIYKEHLKERKWYQGTCTFALIANYGYRCCKRDKKNDEIKQLLYCLLRFYADW